MMENRTKTIRQAEVEPEARRADETRYDNCLHKRIQVALGANPPEESPLPWKSCGRSKLQVLR